MNVTVTTTVKGRITSVTLSSQALEAGGGRWVDAVPPSLAEVCFTRANFLKEQ